MFLRGAIEGIVGITGPEGGGKTLFMTWLAKKHQLYGGRVLAFPGYELTDGKGKVLSEKLDIDQWVTMPPELRDVLICIDEIQNYFNSLRHMAVMSYLFASLAAQRRHRNIGIIYTVQDWGWLDNRIRWLTHVLAICRDLWWSPWGKEEGIGRGELIGVTVWDVKGFYTGKPWTQGAPYLLKNAKALWPCYDSYADVDTWTGLTKVELKKPRLKLDLTGGPDEEEELPPGKPQGPSSIREDNEALLNKFANTPGVDARDLRKLAMKLRNSEGEAEAG